MNEGVSTITDRLQFGLISAGLGAILGAFASLVVLGIFFLLGFPHSFNRWMVVFITGFFFFLGVVRGAKSADTIADAFSAALVVALAGIGLAAGGGGTTVDESPDWRPGLWWTIFYFSGLALVAWFA